MKIEELLLLSAQHHASDLHIASGRPPMIRVDGDLQPLDNLPILTAEAAHELLIACMDEPTKKHFEHYWDVDFALEIKDLGRFRVNVFNEIQGIAAAFRLIRSNVPTLDELDLPSVIKNLTTLRHGLVLVTGPTGSGKSSTLAAIVDKINKERAAHIITIEDPIEFIHTSKKSLINQRELGKSMKSFAYALRAALREDPNVILVGEMRDLETIRLALTAAETGHLVLATLHTPSAPESINRIINVFPGEEKHLVRSMLAESLQAVISQTLVKKVKGGRTVAMEIMICNPAIRNLIREDKSAQMYSVIQTSAASGMQTMEQHLAALRTKHAIA